MFVGYDMVYYTIMTISYFQSVEWLVINGCLLANFIINPLEFASYLIIVVHELRYLLLVNLNHMKWVFSKENKKEERKVTWQLRVLKLVTSKWTTLVVIFMFWLFLLISLFAFIAPSGFSCSTFYTTTLSNSRNIFLICISALIVVICAVELLIDIVSNYKLKCNLYKYFIVQDPYFYRIEIFTACIIGALMAIENILSNLRIVQSFEDSIIFGILGILLHSTLTVFPLTLTIINWIRMKFKKEIHQTDELLLKVLNDEVGRNLFAEFAKKEWSIENIMLWVIDG